jgi:hypothetical protein
MPDLRGGRILQIDPVAPDQHVPRAHPCQAKTGIDLHECAATPAAPFRRVCAHRHTRDAWLCRTHAAAASLLGTCDRCATDTARPHSCPIALVPIPPR